MPDIPEHLLHNYPLIRTHTELEWQLHSKLSHNGGSPRPGSDHKSPGCEVSIVSGYSDNGPRGYLFYSVSVQ